MLKDNGQMKQNIYGKLHSKMHYFTVMNRINSALGSYRNLRFQTDSLIQNDRTNISRFLRTRDIYDRLVTQKVLPPKAEEKWLQENIEINWSYVTKNKFLNQLEPKIREFNYKFLNKILATNKNLYIWKISDSYGCIIILSSSY